MNSFFNGKQTQQINNALAKNLHKISLRVGR
jgi:hypothetical protein